MIKYIVQPEDTVEKIMEKFGVTREALFGANNLRDKEEEEEVFPGLILVIPFDS